MITHAHARSLKRNEDKGLWRPWLAASFVKIQLSHWHMHANKCCGPRIKGVEPDGKKNKDEMEDKTDEKAGSYQPAWLVRATGAWLMSWCSFPAWWPHQREGGTTNTSTHTRPGCLRRTCIAGSSLRAWPQSRNLRQSPRATSCQTSYPSTPWSSLLHSGKTQWRQWHLWLTSEQQPECLSWPLYTLHLFTRTPGQRSVNSRLDATIKTGLHINNRKETSKHLIF